MISAVQNKETVTNSGDLPVHIPINNTKGKKRSVYGEQSRHFGDKEEKYKKRRNVRYKDAIQKKKSTFQDFILKRRLHIKRTKKNKDENEDAIQKKKSTFQDFILKRRLHIKRTKKNKDENEESISKETVKQDNDKKKTKANVIYNNFNLDEYGQDNHAHCDVGNEGQQQLLLQRPLEASKQMLYGVFGHVITALEEYEKRELAKHGIHDPKLTSDIYIPDQRHKTFADIKSIVDCQLLLFETQTKSCPPEALAEVIGELRRRTLCWTAVREDIGIKEVHQTDYYISKLYEILVKGSTLHRAPAVSVITEDVMRSGVQAIMHGDHDRANIDREFKTNPGKKASGPITRSSEMIRGGAERIVRALGTNDLLKYVIDDVNKIENDGQDNIR